MIIRVIDFETTGTPTEENTAGVIEVGACDIAFSPNYGEWRVDEGTLWSGLCSQSIKIDAGAKATHHIEEADLEGQPPVSERFMRLMSGPPTYFAAHNADFEKTFFAGGEVPWICTYKVACRVFPDDASHKNQNLRYSRGLVLDRSKASPAHRAGPDAYVTAHLLVDMLKHGTASIDDMVRWSKGPALLPICNFGQKHRGQKFSEVPSDYLSWVVEKSDADRNVKATAKYHLKQRSAK